MPGASLAPRRLAQRNAIADADAQPVDGERRGDGAPDAVALLDQRQQRLGRFGAHGPQQRVIVADAADGGEDAAVLAGLGA